jgi:chromosome segregation ATPase
LSAVGRLPDIGPRSKHASTEAGALAGGSHRRHAPASSISNATMTETDLDELREQIEEHQAKIDAIRANLDERERAETTDVDLEGLRADLDEREREIEDLRESLATTNMFREALAGPVKVDEAPDDSRGFR